MEAHMLSSGVQHMLCIQKVNAWQLHLEDLR